MVHTSSDSATYKRTEPFLTQSLIVRGKVKALFSDEAFKRFKAMEILMATTGSPSRGLGQKARLAHTKSSRGPIRLCKPFIKKSLAEVTEKPKGETLRDNRYLGISSAFLN
jgi:hypothetical protein